MSESRFALRELASIDRPTAVDLAFALTGVVVGVIGFRTTFAGHEELTVGLPAIVLGAVVGLAIARAHLSLLPGALAAVVAFFVLGPLGGVREHALVGIVPTPQSTVDLIDGTINGWRRLLTTVPPAGQAGNLLAIPYLAGFAGAALTVVLALAVRRNSLCVLGPIAVMSTSILFGTERPAALHLQGTAFAAVMVGWLVVRNRRQELIDPTSHRPRHALESVAMLSVVGIGGILVGPLLPFIDTNDRYVLRDEIEPPFDPSQYPSPLSSFRNFHGQVPLEGTLMTVDGLPEGHTIRYAVMDDYDGFVWRAAPPRTATAGSYDRVGPRIPTDAIGPSRRVHFTMGALAARDAVWIPTVGVTTAITFEGPSSSTLEDELRFNRVTRSAAAPVALAKGDKWTVTATLPPAVSVDELRKLPVAGMPPPAGDIAITDRTRDRVGQWTAGASSPYAKVEAIIKNLVDVGAYNDGSAEQPIASGHSIYRLAPFLEADQPQGNGEQFAAAVAYLARAEGIPARVVFEFAPAFTGGPVEVTAKDARAMVEIALEGVGWVAAPNPTPDENDKPTPQLAQVEKKPENEVQPPPPAAPKPPADLPDNLPPVRKQLPPDGGSGWFRFVLLALKILGVLAVIALIVAGPPIAVVALKMRRRRRRRTVGTPSARVLGAWQELTDVARDHGALVPPKATRREVGTAVPQIGSAGFPDDVDSLLFGPAEPGEAEVDAIWSRFDDLEKELLGGKSRAERVRGAVSLNSLR